MDYFSKFILKRKEEVLSTIKHHTLHSIAPGNQWTMINTEKINSLKTAGYKIEVFGSPFNTRLPYFGSLYKCDEPFGRIGTYEEILTAVELREDIKWRDTTVISHTDKNIKLLIQPPSGKFILNDLCARALRMLNARSVEIYMGMPAYNNKFLNYFQQKIFKKYFISYEYMTKSWDFYAVQNFINSEHHKPKIIGTVYNKKKYEESAIEGLVEIDMTGREWHNFLLRS